MSQVQLLPRRSQQPQKALGPKAGGWGVLRQVAGQMGAQRAAKAKAGSEKDGSSVVSAASSLQRSREFANCYQGASRRGIRNGTGVRTHEPTIRNVNLPLPHVRSLLTLTVCVHVHMWQASARTSTRTASTATRASGSLARNTGRARFGWPTRVHTRVCFYYTTDQISSLIGQNLAH